MASQSGEHDELCFNGESAEEAQDFVQAVHRRAYAAGRPKDNAWIAEFACPCFSRQALIWYETLDEETQNDWKLLKRAIFAEFSPRQPAPATVPSAAPALVTSLSSLTPASPPPSPVTVKIGRIRVDSEDHTVHGYFSESRWKYVGVESHYGELFEVDTLGQTVMFQEGRESLIIRAHQNHNNPLVPGTDMYGRMMKSSVGTLTLWEHTWSIAEDGNITAMLLGTDGGQYDANFMLCPSDLSQVIRVCADKKEFVRRNWNYTRVTLHLEPLSDV